MVVAIEPACANRAKHEYTLAPIDLAQGDSHIMFVYFYPNTHRRPDFMPMAALIDGFAESAHYYSILLGHFGTECDSETVIVDELNPNVPCFREIQTDLLFETLADLGYRWSSWPEGLDTQDTTELQNGKPLFLSAVLLRFKDNTGVALRVKTRHSIMDGTGFTSFMRYWSNAVRATVDGRANSITKVPMEPATLDFDRQTLLKAISYTKEPKNNSGSSITSNIVLSDQSSLESHKDSSTLQEQRDPGSMHIFRFSKDALSRLKRDFSSSEVEVSVNDALTALIWRALVRSSRTARQHRLILACDVRRRVELPQNYMGNASFPLQIDLGRQELLSQPKHAIASSIRTLVNSVNAKYLQHCLRFLDQYGPILDMESKCDKSSSFFCTTNCSRFPFYQTDFGYGKPERILVPHYLTPGFSIWLPADGAGGIDAIISMLDLDFNIISMDSELLEYCKIII